MRTLELRRHSFTKRGEARGRGSHLSGAGVTAARELGEGLGVFDYVVASTSPRTLETAIAMGFSVDELMEMPSPTETGEVEFHSWRDWSDPYTTLRTKSLESPSIATYMDEQAARVLAAVDCVADGGRLLVVGHGGWIETVVAGLAALNQLPRIGGSFWHLDGIRLSFGTDSPVSIADVSRYRR